MTDLSFELALASRLSLLCAALAGILPAFGKEICL